MSNSEAGIVAPKQEATLRLRTSVQKETNLPHKRLATRTRITKRNYSREYRPSQTKTEEILPSNNNNDPDWISNGKQTARKCFQKARICTRRAGKLYKARSRLAGWLVDRLYLYQNQKSFGFRKERKPRCVHETKSSPDLSKPNIASKS